MSVLIIAALSLAISTNTQTNSTPRTLEQLFACDVIQDTEAMNSCYRKQTDELRKALRDGTIVVVDQASAREHTRASFGLRNISPLPSTFEVPEPDQVTGTITSANRFGEGRYRFNLSDGSSWLQIDSEPVRRTPRAGAEVTVRRAALGSYFLRIGNGRDIRVSRDQ